MGIFSRNIERDENNDIAPVSFTAPRPITAAATRIDLRNKTQIESISKNRINSDWQKDAWAYFDLIGEVGYSARLIAAVTSRVRLYPAFISDEENEPVHVRRAEGLDPEVAKASQDVLRLLGTGNGGIPGVLRDAAMNLFITGECYLVQQPAQFSTGEAEQWSIRSVDEIVATSGRNATVGIKATSSAANTDLVPLPDGAFIGRIWRMHPRYSNEADSSLKSLLELMDELLLLNKSARKTLKSRLNAGILYIPDEMSNISQSDGDIDENSDTYAELSDDNSASFEDELIEAATTPISDEGSASAVVPLIVRGPADLADKIKHITFEQAFDPHHSERADKVLNRILAGLDIPKDIVSGVADVKYSNATAIEESLYKSHVEPLILLIVDALTVVFLRPILRAMGHDEDLINRLVVWYDPSPITAKPSKAEAATLGYDKRVLSGEAWRRENGFSEADKPDEIEIGSRIAMEKGLLSEPVTEALFRLMIPTVMEQVRSSAIEQSPSGSTVADVINNNQSSSETEESPEPPTELIEP